MGLTKFFENNIRHKMRISMRIFLRFCVRPSWAYPWAYRKPQPQNRGVYKEVALRYGTATQRKKPIYINYGCGIYLSASA